MRLVGNSDDLWLLTLVRNPNHTIEAFVGNWVVCTQLVQLLAPWLTVATLPTRAGSRVLPAKVDLFEVVDS